MVGRKLTTESCEQLSKLLKQQKYQPPRRGYSSSATVADEGLQLIPAITVEDGNNETGRFIMARPARASGHTLVPTIDGNDDRFFVHNTGFVFWQDVDHIFLADTPILVAPIGDKTTEISQAYLVLSIYECATVVENQIGFSFGFPSQFQIATAGSISIQLSINDAQNVTMQVAPGLSTPNNLSIDSTGLITGQLSEGTYFIQVRAAKNSRAITRAFRLVVTP